MEKLFSFFAIKSRRFMCVEIGRLLFIFSYYAQIEKHLSFFVCLFVFMQRFSVAIHTCFCGGCIDSAEPNQFAALFTCFSVYQLCSDSLYIFFFVVSTFTRNSVQELFCFTRICLFVSIASDSSKQYEYVPIVFSPFSRSVK